MAYGEDITINVSITNEALEQKLNKAITKILESLRPRSFNQNMPRQVCWRRFSPIKPNMCAPIGFKFFKVAIL